MLFCSEKFLVFFTIVFISLLGAALASSPRLASSGRELLFLCQLEQMVGPHHLRLHGHGLFHRSRNGSMGVHAGAATLGDSRAT